MIAGIHGKKGAGKDALLKRMQWLAPDTFVKLSFADLLKDSVCKLLDITREELEQMKNEDAVHLMLAWRRTDGIKESRAFSMRLFLQRYGTEAHREVFGQDFWVSLAMDEAVRLAGEGYVPVFTDVRFVNEAEAVRLHDGMILHVIGPHDDGDTHPSEVPLPSSLIDHTVENWVWDDGFANLDALAAEACNLLLGVGHEQA